MKEQPPKVYLRLDQENTHMYIAPSFAALEPKPYLVTATQLLLILAHADHHGMLAAHTIN